MKHLFFALAFLMAAFAPCHATPLPSAPPAELGFAPDRLERLHALLQRRIDREQLAGAVTLIARDGKICDVRTYGFRDRENRLPMQRDTLFRIASMTKLVTAVAALTLDEEGRFGLDDDIGDYLPEWKHLRVAARNDASPAETVAARPITVRHLLTHTAGIGANGPSAFAHAPAPSLHAFAAELAQMPLAAQPGDRFIYGLGYDVLGYLVEVVSGQPFDRYVRDRVLTPLGMSDTFFQIPAAQQTRLARTYVHETGQPLALRPTPPDAYYLGGIGFQRGSGGLVTTIDDFARFAQMLLNRGELDGVRILCPKTVQLMTTDQLTTLKEPNTFLQPFESYGFGVSVRVTLGGAPTPGSLGQFGWTGAATTYCSMDPQEGTLALLFAQHYPWNEDDLFSKFSTTFYQALVTSRQP